MSPYASVQATDQSHSDYTRPACDDPSGGRRPAQIPQLDTTQASKESHDSIHNLSSYVWFCAALMMNKVQNCRPTILYAGNGALLYLILWTYWIALVTMTLSMGYHTVFLQDCQIISELVYVLSLTTSDSEKTIHASQSSPVQNQSRLLTVSLYTLNHKNVTFYFWL